MNVQQYRKLTEDQRKRLSPDMIEALDDAELMSEDTYTFEKIYGAWLVAIGVMMKNYDFTGQDRKKVAFDAFKLMGIAMGYSNKDLEQFISLCKPATDRMINNVLSEFNQPLIQVTDE
jgi:hypothetical protein